MRHLYIHVPFCARRCVYCDFSITVRREVPAKRFLRSVLMERDTRIEAGEWNDDRLRTLYIGGGTPSRIPADVLAELLSAVLALEYIDAAEPEVTVEANPDDVTPEAARTWARAGVNRVSLGVQSFSPRVLDWMHRTHDADQAVVAVHILHDVGIRSVSLDLIFGLPLELDHALGNDLERAVSLSPDHLSVYGLTSEPGTALYRWIAGGKLELPSGKTYASAYQTAHDFLAGCGYEHYEVSNFAKVGFRSRHNTAYWDRSVYGGLGPSAHSFDGKLRRWNIKPWVEYERVVSSGGNPTDGREVLTPAQALLERAYLGLRTSDGLGPDEMAGFDGAAIAKIEEKAWGGWREGRWVLSPSGWTRLDELVTALTTSPEGG